MKAALRIVMALVLTGVVSAPARAQNGASIEILGTAGGQGIVAASGIYTNPNGGPVKITLLAVGAPGGAGW
jgi:hypothetical protein